MRRARALCLALIALTFVFGGLAGLARAAGPAVSLGVDFAPGSPAHPDLGQAFAYGLSPQNVGDAALDGTSQKGLTVGQLRHAVSDSVALEQVCNDISGGSTQRQFNRDLHIVTAANAMGFLADTLAQDPDTRYASPDVTNTGTATITMRGLAEQVISICGAGDTYGDALRTDIAGLPAH